MVATVVEKIQHSVFYVTGMYLRDISNMIFCHFALEFELSERLLFLFYLVNISFLHMLNLNCSMLKVAHQEQTCDTT